MDHATPFADAYTDAPHDLSTAARTHAAAAIGFTATDITENASTNSDQKEAFPMDKLSRV